jgi:hypothetical protein
MISYAWTWWIIIGAACLGVVPFYMLVRPIGSVFLRVLVCGVVVALLVTPAPVPTSPLNYAPAFVIALFEGVLQSDGEPRMAVQMLLLGVMVVVAVTTLGRLGLRRFARND